MSDKTRTVLIWFNNDAQRLTFAVNPREIRVTRPQTTHEFHTIDGEVVHAAAGRGLLQVEFSTFLPCADSRFYQGVPPLEALALLKTWQNSQRPVRLIISGTDINDAFLITRLQQTISEGDEDIGISLSLKEYKFFPLEGPSALVGSSGLNQRPDERPRENTYVVKKGDTLWAIAVRYYGDGTRWQEIARRNGVADPRKLSIGKVLVL